MSNQRSFEDTSEALREITRLCVLSSNLNDAGKTVEAIESSLAALKLCEQEIGNENAIFADCLDIFALTLLRVPKYRGDALGHYVTALKVRQKVLGRSHIKVAESYDNIAVFHQTIGDKSTARGAFEHALAIRKELFGDVDSRTAAAATNLGILLLELPEPDLPRVTELFDKAVHAFEALQSLEINAAISFSNLACVIRFNDPDRAVNLAKKAIAIEEILMGRSNLGLLSSLDILGNIYQDIGYREDAIAVLERALSIAERHDNSDVAAAKAYRQRLSILKNEKMLHREASIKSNIVLFSSVRSFVSLSKEKKVEGNVSEARNQLSDFILKRASPAELEEFQRLHARLLLRLKRAAHEIPDWGDPNQPSDVKDLSAPSFLKRFYSFLIVGGFIDKAAIRESDRKLMADVEQYISRRLARKSGLGDAEGLAFITNRLPKEELPQNFRTEPVRGRPTTAKGHKLSRT